MSKKIQKWLTAGLSLVLLTVFLGMNSEADAQGRGRRGTRSQRKAAAQQQAVPAPTTQEAEKAAEKLEEAVEEKAVNQEREDAAEVAAEAAAEEKPAAEVAEVKEAVE
ncbi:MAG: hypothetical protein Q4D98_01035, partial [Planctomycetia bacterium]|nr:hypothetical protein [Planctomycetia bacterium]